CRIPEVRRRAMTGDSERPAQPPGHHPSGSHEHGHSVSEPGEFLDAPLEEASPEPEVGLARRFLNLRTIGSIVFGVAMLALLFKVVLNIDLGETWRQISGANLLFLLLETLSYYATFPLRGL